MVQQVNSRLYQDLATLKTLGAALPGNPLAGLAKDVAQTRGGQSLSLPTYDAGHLVLQDGVVTTKTGVGNLFSYSLDSDTTFSASFPTAFNSIVNSTTSWQEIGKILVPGDSLNLTSGATVSFEVTADAVLAGCSLGVLIGHRDSTVRSQTKYYIVKALPGDYASTTAKIKVSLTPVHAGMVSLAKTDDATAPTAYPDNSVNQVFAVNLLAGVSIRLFVKFATSTGSMRLTAGAGTCTVMAPSRNLVDISQTYSRLPYVDNDMWKSQLPPFTLAKAEVSAANPASTGNSSTGTLNASGTAGSDLLTVYSTTGVSVGMYPLIGSTGVVTPGAGPLSAFRPHMPDAVATVSAFGAGVAVTEIVNATQVRLSAPLKANVSLRGRTTSGGLEYIPCVGFYSSAETACIRMGQGSASIGANPFTGVGKTANAATAARVCVPVVRIKSTDPVKTWRFTQVNAYNPWIFETSASNATIGFETFDNGTFQLKTPSITQTYLLNGSQNPDRNLILITECGRYSIEMIGVDFSVTPITVTRVIVSDLAGRSTVAPDIYDLGAISYGTRAYGGPLSAGLVRKFEMDQCYSTGNTAADISRAMDAIKHPIAILMSNAQGKSNNYCPDPDVQGTKVVYKAYRSAHAVHAPSVAVGGSGYAVGDVLYVVGGTYTTTMSCVVTAVSGGAVTSVHVQRTGQYKTLPSDASALATTTSGTGTGCVLNALSVPTAPDQTTASVAFQDINSTIRVLQYPASVSDNGYSANYAGVVPMGALFTLPNGLDLVTEWTNRRTTAPTAKSSSYELLAVLAAIQKYGAYVVDISGSFQQLVAVDSDFAYSDNYSNLHGDTGSATYPNLVEIKRLLTYVENVSPLNRAAAYANPLPMRPAL